MLLQESKYDRKSDRKSDEKYPIDIKQPANNRPNRTELKGKMIASVKYKIAVDDKSHPMDQMEILITVGLFAGGAIIANAKNLLGDLWTYHEGGADSKYGTIDHKTTNPNEIDERSFFHIFKCATEGKNGYIMDIAMLGGDIHISFRNKYVKVFEGHVIMASVDVADTIRIANIQRNIMTLKRENRQHKKHIKWLMNIMLLSALVIGILAIILGMKI